MDDKKFYSTPTLYPVDLHHEQAILSACSLLAANPDGRRRGHHLSIRWVQERQDRRYIRQCSETFLKETPR